MRRLLRIALRNERAGDSLNSSRALSRRSSERKPRSRKNGPTSACNTVAPTASNNEGRLSRQDLSRRGSKLDSRTSTPRDRLTEQHPAVVTAYEELREMLLNE